MQASVATKWVLSSVLAALSTCGAAMGQRAESGDFSRPQTIVTVVPKKGEATAPVTAQAVSARIEGKKAAVADWHAFRAEKTDLQLVLMIDDSARSSLGLHIREMQKFLTDLPPTAEVAVVYMHNGTAQMLHPFTTDHQTVASSVRVPASAPGANSSPYFALSDLMKRWPAPAGEGIRREVVMVTDGVDRYYTRRFDPNDPYVNAAIDDSVRAGVVVYSIYYEDAGLADLLGAGFTNGQNYLVQLTGAVGGQTFYQGTGNPVDFTPYLSEITQRLNNQYELRLTPPSSKKGMLNLKVQVSAPNTRTEAPQKIYMTAAEGAPGH